MGLITAETPAQPAVLTEGYDLEVLFETYGRPLEGDGQNKLPS